MPEVIIIGKGPAGVSAGLYTARAGLKTTIIGRDNGALAKGDKVENYWGFAEPINAADLISAGLAQAERVGCDIITDEVVGIGFEEKLVVKTRTATFQADAVLIATGAVRSRPIIEGLSRFEGSGVSYCAVCDAFFHKGKDVCVLGSGEYARHEALELKPIVGSVTVLTNGAEPTADFAADGIAVDTRAIASLDGEKTLSAVVFADGEQLAVSGAFVAIGTASSSDLARKLGAQTNGSRIVIDSSMKTNIPALYAAGDCTGGLLQIAKAVGEGAVAGTTIVRDMKKL